MMNSKWLVAVLVISIGLNLALAGFLLGRHSGGVVMGDPTAMFPRWFRNLPEPRQDELRDGMVDHIKAIRPKVRLMRQHHRALVQAIAAEPFELTELQEVLASMRQQNMHVQQTSHLGFADFVAQLNSAERQQLASDLRRPRRGFAERHGPHPGEPPQL